jgi:transcriptional regulator with XRE-family HTH domain
MGNRIRELRLERAKVAPTLFTADAVAFRVRVAPNTLNRWERDIMRPSARHQKALAKELGVSVTDLGLDDPA